MLTKVLRLRKVLLGKDFFAYTQYTTTKLSIGNAGANFTVAIQLLNDSSIVYSFGVGTDISFDLGLIEKYGMNVFAFDPTPKSINWVKSQQIPNQFKLYEYGLADYDGSANFNPPENPDHVSHTLLEKPRNNTNAIPVQVRTLSSIMKEFGHTQIDVLKMDIEGAEYSVIENVLKSGVKIKQWLIEFHHRFDNVGVNKTKQAIQLLNKNGYKIFDVSDTGEEFSFIKID